jgi:Kef-type K+ transport system membrane component KefB
VLVVAAVAFAVPIGLGLFPSLRLPSVVLEIVAGVILGPAGLGLVEVDLALRALALIGLAFLLFLADLEIDLDRLRGRPLRSAATGLALSMMIAFSVSPDLGLPASPGLRCSWRSCSPLRPWASWSRCSRIQDGSAPRSASWS